MVSDGLQHAVSYGIFSQPPSFDDFITIGMVVKHANQNIEILIICDHDCRQADEYTLQLAEQLMVIILKRIQNKEGNIEM